MKGFALILLCALVAVQGRYTALESTRNAASLGENPWVVHLRIAVGTSGLLNTCAGSLIDNRFVLTAASCVSNARFIWIRFGTLNVINPELVIETSTVRINPGYIAATGVNNVAIVSINRYVASTDNISPVPLGSVALEFARYCGFSKDDSAPGEQLNCFEVGVATDDKGLVVSSDEVVPSKFDIGAPLVSDGAQVGILTGVESEDGIGKFDAISLYADWIAQETGLDLNDEAVHFV